MEKFFEDYLERLQTLHRHISEAIAGLPQEALDWSPGPEMNSMVVLAAHVAGSERYWIGDVALGDPSGRVREAEFREHGWDEVAIRERLDRSLDYARSHIGSLVLDALNETRRTEEGEERTVGWALLHAMEHVGIHVGHFQLMRQMWENRA